MANPYLIQALYGPKPTITADADTTAVVQGEESSSGALRDRTHEQSLTEMLYGNSTVESRPNPNLTHPDRQLLIKSEDNLEDGEDMSVEAQPYVPRGSNALPLGNRSDPTFTMTKTGPRSSIPPSTRSSPPQSGSIPPVMMTNSVCGALQYPPERYLPPPGPYFDQFRLVNIFGAGFFFDKCFRCWGPQHPVDNFGKCDRVCAVCKITDHPNESCSMLYCTQLWYTTPNFPHGFASRCARQLRPAKTDIVILQQLGLIVTPSGWKGPIIPNTEHPLVQEFYHDKTPSQMLWFKLPSCHAKPKSDPKPSLSGNMVNSALDPRLRSLDLATARLSIEPNLAMASTADHTLVDVPTNKQVAGSEIEQRIQELEDEVLSLRTESIAKDREIRKLQARNEQSRDNGYETGSKRLRM